MDSQDRSPAPPPALNLPRLEEVRIALGMLTAARWSAADVRSAAFGRAAPLFPIAGASVAGLLLLIDASIAVHLPTAIAALLLAGVWDVATRGYLRAAEPPSAGASITIFVVKAVALWLLAPRRLALFFAPIFAAWSIVVLAVGARDAANSARKLAPFVLFNEFAVASLLTLAAVFSVAEGIGILLGVVAATLTVGLRVVLHQRFGGVSVRSLVIAAQLIETATLWVLVGLQRVL